MTRRPPPARERSRRDDPRRGPEQAAPQPGPPPTRPRPAARPAAASEPSGPRPASYPRLDEVAIGGVKACRARFRHRPEAILRVFYRADRRAEITDLLGFAAAHGLVRRELDEEGLRKVSGSVHHEGLTLVARPLTFARCAPAEAAAAGSWLALDGVENPHNQGAIARSVAFFGLAGLLVGGPRPGRRVSAALLRNAEGGAETIQLAATEDLATTLRELGEQGLPVIGVETGCALGLTTPPLPTPCVLVLGSEAHGLSPAVRRGCRELRAIEGAGEIGSLNVSVAAGIALAELTRPRPSRPTPAATGPRRAS